MDLSQLGTTRDSWYYYTRARDCIRGTLLKRSLCVSKCTVRLHVRAPQSACAAQRCWTVPCFELKFGDSDIRGPITFNLSKTHSFKNSRFNLFIKIFLTNDRGGPISLLSPDFSSLICLYGEIRTVVYSTKQPRSLIDMRAEGWLMWFTISL